jgi:hypothetical protein
MAHSALHFSIGMAAAMLVFAPPVISALRRRCELARTVGRWIVASWALGLFAIVPSLLHAAGAPPALYGGWWMNIFFLHPLINRLDHRGYLVGAMLMGLAFAAQYAVLLAAIARAPRRRVSPRA